MQLGQVGGEIITPGNADIWGRGRIKTLWSPSHMLYSFGTFPQQPDSFWRWIKRTLASLNWVSPHLLPSWASFHSLLKLSGKCKLSLLVYISCLLSLGCIKCYWLSGLTRHSYERIVEWKNRGSQARLSVQFALHLLPYRGSHDLTFLLPYPSSVPALLLFCFTLLSVLYLKTSSPSPVNASETKYTLIKCNASCTGTW